MTVSQMNREALRVLRGLKIDRGDGIELVDGAIGADGETVALPVTMTRTATASAMTIGDAVGTGPLAIVMASDVSRLVNALSKAISDWAQNRPMPGLSPSASVGFAFALIAEADRQWANERAAASGSRPIDWGSTTRELSAPTIAAAARVLRGGSDPTGDEIQGTRNVTSTCMGEDGKLDLDLVRAEVRDVLRERSSDDERKKGGLN